MTIYVSNLSDLETHTRAVRPERLISIIQPELQPPTPAGVAPQRHLRVPVHDVSEPAFESILPERRHVETIVAFLRDWSADDSLMVHCFAGVSRSSAVALIADVLHSGDALASAGEFDQFRGTYLFIVPVITQQRLIDLKMRQQPSAMTRVFASDAIDLAENGERTRTEIFPVPDRCGHKIDCAGHEVAENASVSKKPPQVIVGGRERITSTRDRGETLRLQTREWKVPAPVIR